MSTEKQSNLETSKPENLQGTDSKEPTTVTSEQSKSSTTKSTDPSFSECNSSSSSMVSEPKESTAGVGGSAYSETKLPSSNTSIPIKSETAPGKSIGGFESQASTNDSGISRAETGQFAAGEGSGASPESCFSTMENPQQPSNLSTVKREPGEAPLSSQPSGQSSGWVGAPTGTPSSTATPPCSQTVINSSTPVSGQAANTTTTTTANSTSISSATADSTTRAGRPTVSNSGTWHVNSNDDVEPRRVVIQQIVQLLESCKPKTFRDRQEKLIDLARRLEVALYKQSKTREEYMNKDTLRMRVRELAKQSSAQQQQAQQQLQQPTHSAAPQTAPQSVVVKSEAPPTPGLVSSQSAPPAISQPQVGSTHASRPAALTTAHQASTPSNSPPLSTSNMSEAEQKQQIIKQRQQRLLLLKHASKCPSPEGTCKATPHCASMKRLWKHIPTCKDQRCTTAHCVSSRYVLSHYHRCKNDECPVCKPVRLMSRPGHSTVQAGGRTTSAPAAPKPAATRIDPKVARNCVSGTGPSLPFSMSRERVEMHIRSLRVERLQMAVTPLLRKLMENKHNKDIFNEPVDPVALNIPDYPKIIKNPMDLGTIRKRLEECYYKSLDIFQEDVYLVFRNAMKFNPPENDYHVRAHTLLKQAESEFPKIKNKLDRDGRKKGETCQLCRDLQCETCPLCERGCIPFEPKVLFCSGPCTQRIARNATYYTGVGNNYCWCSDCYDKCKGGTLVVNNQAFNKRELTKKKNNELFGEPWVSCDLCQRWMHQVCALFNTRKDTPGSTQQYICPLCLILESRKGEEERKSAPEAVKVEGEKQVKMESSPSVSGEPSSDAGAKGKYQHLVLPAGKSVPGASALPQSRLSVFLEMWLRDRIDKYQERDSTDPRKYSFDTGPSSDKLHVRVMSNFDELCKVKPFVKTLLPNYPDQFTFRSRCILLFQELDGVDVLFFAMFVQEYGSDCPEPNNRKIYIAYLDSVYYFRPRRMRTTVYHELLLAYLEYTRRMGFTSAYIWACPPPNKRDDYIIHCHPEDQRVQTADRLRKWYHEMIKRGVVENICLGSCALFEEHFESVPRPSAKKSKSKKKKKATKSKTKNQKKGMKSKKGKKGGLVNQRTAPATTRQSSVALAITETPAPTQPPPEASTSSTIGSPPMAATGMEEENDLFGDLPDLGEGDEDMVDDEEEEEGKESGEKGDEDAVEEVGAEEGKPSIFVTPGNGLASGDDRMLPEDMERRKDVKLAINGNLPYFEGDYWPQEAEELAKERELKKKKEESRNPDEQGRSKRKRRRNGEAIEGDTQEGEEEEKSEGAEPEGEQSAPAGDADSKASPPKKEESQDCDMTKEEIEDARKQLIQRLSGQLDAMKDDFLVVKLAYECFRCGTYLLRGRWECRHAECRANSGFNKPCPFALCNTCYIRETLRPKDQQHGGGCVALGPEGEPKDEADEAAKNDGKDQTRIDVNEEAKKKLKEDAKKKTDETKASDSKSTTNQNGVTEESSSTKTESSPMNVEESKDPNSQKRTISDVNEGSNSEDPERAAKRSKLEIEDSQLNHTSPAAAPPQSAGSGSNDAGSNVQTKKDGTSEEDQLKKDLEEWRKQEISSSRIPGPDRDDHLLQYVDENVHVRTPDMDRILKNHLLETRHAFLSLCTGNRYQFDQLRRAKHSTMMVLYHLHNPDAPAHLYVCFNCQKDILEGKRHHCDICAGGDFDLCDACNTNLQHEHPLTAYPVTCGVNAETSEAQRMQRVTEMRRARKHSLALFLHALVHSSTCVDPSCVEAPCKKMKELLKHRMNCVVRVRGGCEICRRVLCLVQMHARNCKSKNCRVPHCEDLKAHIQAQLQQVKRRPQDQQQAAGHGTRAKNKSSGRPSQQGGVTGSTVQEGSDPAAHRRPRTSTKARGTGPSRSKSTGQTVSTAVNQAVSQTVAAGAPSSGAPLAGQPMQATVVEGSGGTRLKIRPAISKPKPAAGGGGGGVSAQIGQAPRSSRGRGKK